jgi:hypothetical protein
MTPYTLNLIGSFTPWRTYSSTEFFGVELRKRFEKLPHVTLKTQCFNDIDFEEADFALIHAYFSTNVYAHINTLKRKVWKIANFMEEPHPNADYNWYYSDIMHNEYPIQGQLVHPPVVRSLLVNEPKEPNTILLDHDIADFWYYRHPSLDWNERIWEWVKPFKDTHKIYQIQRHEKDATPDFITRLPHCQPAEYLDLTKRMETFILTHHGSYNHTAVEMIARGIRTLVPHALDSFVPTINMRIFGLSSFKDGEELANLIREPIVPDFWDSQINKCGDMDAVVALMDHQFQTWKGMKTAVASGWQPPVNLRWLFKET